MRLGQAIEEFLQCQSVAVAGVSRQRNKFGNAVFRDLRAKGWQLLPVNPKASMIEGVTCYPNLSALPEKTPGLLVVTPRAQTEGVISEACRLGIRRIWIQQSSETAAALQLCRENGITPVSGLCVLMFAEPCRFPHSLHRFFFRLFSRGKLNQEN
jgi:hypothetical protein